MACSSVSVGGPGGGLVSLGRLQGSGGKGTVDEVTDVRTKFFVLLWFIVTGIFNMGSLLVVVGSCCILAGYFVCDLVCTGAGTKRQLAGAKKQ